MTKPVARMTDSRPSHPPAIGEVKVIVYEMKQGQMEVYIQWPDDAPPGNKARRNEFIRLVQAELEIAVE